MALLSLVGCSFLCYVFNWVCITGETIQSGWAAHGWQLHGRIQQLYVCLWPSESSSLYNALNFFNRRVFKYTGLQVNKQKFAKFQCCMSYYFYVFWPSYNDCIVESLIFCSHCIFSLFRILDRKWQDSYNAWRHWRRHSKTQCQLWDDSQSLWIFILKNSKGL